VTTTLPSSFDSREALIQHVKDLAPWAIGEASHILGGREKAEEQLQNIDPVSYVRSRNYGNGAVTRLSPYIRCGILSLNEVRNHALTKCSQSAQITKFIQELAWRDFWQRIYKQHPEWIWSDIEAYKTGFTTNDYANELPGDIENGTTGIACLDYFISELISTGYLHNHARMYLASYIVHFRRIKWQMGARWFLSHLLDSDPASNNLSWQWVASTFSNKPYIFNLENVDKYFGQLTDTSSSSNELLDASYEELTARLFPNKRGFK